MMPPAHRFSIRIHKLAGQTRAFHFESANITLKPLPGDDRIAVFSLCRQEGKNAFSKAMVEDFNTAVKYVAREHRLLAVVIHSEVNKVFCAGADLKERLNMPDNQVGQFVAGLRSSFQSLSKVPMPTIAAIEGVALGGGLELALACDMRIAGDGAQLGLPETSLAIIPGAGGTQRLSRIVGVAKAKELIFMGKKLSAEEAHSLGLVNAVVPAGEAYKKALEWAHIIAEKGPIGIRMAKLAIDEGISENLDDALIVEDKYYQHVIFTHDRKEGLKAFVEKRSPKYLGQ